MLLTYIASLASVAWKHRKLVTDKESGVAMRKSGPRGAVQLILVVVTLIVLAVGWLLVLGGTATVGLRPLSGETVIVLVVVAALVLFLGGFTDETTLSLHPFYRGRLASAFAVRRVYREADGETIARAYQPEERSVLSEYGVVRRAAEFPHVIFAASATVGEKRTAPGGHRVSYTFCADWVGGPDLGYVDSGRLQDLAPPRLQRDLTVQGAVALSGAAIAASIGGQRTAWYETLFVVTGLRLGAWMPNPAYLISEYTGDCPWYEPRLPRVRRLSSCSANSSACTRRRRRWCRSPTAGSTTTSAWSSCSGGAAPASTAWTRRGTTRRPPRRCRRPSPRPTTNSAWRPSSSRAPGAPSPPAVPTR